MRLYIKNLISNGFIPLFMSKNARGLTSAKLYSNFSLVRLDSACYQSSSGVYRFAFRILIFRINLQPGYTWILAWIREPEELVWLKNKKIKMVMKLKSVFMVHGMPARRGGGCFPLFFSKQLNTEELEFAKNLFYDVVRCGKCYIVGLHVELSTCLHVVCIWNISTHDVCIWNILKYYACCRNTSVRDVCCRNTSVYDVCFTNISLHNVCIRTIFVIFFASETYHEMKSASETSKCIFSA